jgi:hypothetical protein
MIDESAKEHLHDHLRWVRETLVWKLDGLCEIMVHVLSDTTRHAGHADILREQLDGAVGVNAESTALHGHDSAFWEARCAKIEQAARAADPTNAPPQPR